MKPSSRRRRTFPRLGQDGVPRSVGAVRSTKTTSERHHPGASRHPSSSRRGKRFSPISLHWDSSASTTRENTFRFSSISLHWDSSASTTRENTFRFSSISLHWDSGASTTRENTIGTAALRRRTLTTNPGHSQRSVQIQKLQTFDLRRPQQIRRLRALREKG